MMKAVKEFALFPFEMIKDGMDEKRYEEVGMGLFVMCLLPLMLPFIFVVTFVGKIFCLLFRRGKQ